MTKLRNTEQIDGSFEDGTSNKLDGLTQEVVSENLENLEHKVEHMTSEVVTKESKIISQELTSLPKKENQETAQQASPSFPQRTSASKRNKTIPSPKREIPQAPAQQETSHPKEESTEPRRLPKRTVPSIPPSPVRDAAESVEPTIPTPPQSSRKKRTPTQPDQPTPQEQQPVKQEHYEENTVPVSSPETKEKDDTWIEIEEKQTSSFGKYRGRMMGKQQVGFTSEQPTQQQAQQAEKNKQIMRTSANKVSASLENTLPPAELQLIEESIMRYVRRDTWYRDEIRKIRSTGMKERKSSQEIDKNIEAYNTEVKKQLLPFFIMEMQAGNMVLKRSGRIVHLQAQTIKQLNANTEFTALKVAYEQFIRNPYLDLTNQNHLDWPQATSTNRLENQLIKSVATNPELEEFLFDHPDRTYTPIHTETQKSLMKSKNPDIYTHLKDLLGETDNKEEKTPAVRNQLIQRFISRIDPYTQKRINQTIALNHCAVLNQCFGAYKSAGKSTIDDMQIDFDRLVIDQTSLTFSQPITYQHLHTTLSLDGQSGYLQLPNGLTKLFGGADEMRRIQSDTLPAKELQNLLTQAVQLTPQELMKCTSQKDIEQIITQKIEDKIEKVTPQADKKRLNTLLEQEALLANRKHFYSGENITGTNEQQISFAKKGHAKTLQQTLRRRIYGDRSQGPFGIEQLRTINNICRDPKMESLFAQSTKNNPHGIETFLEHVGFFNRGPTMNNDDTILFFTSLHKMATSGVPPQEESGYRTLTKLLKTHADGVNLPVGLSGTNAPYMYTTNHQLVPTSFRSSLI